MDWSAYVEYDASNLPPEVYEHILDAVLPHEGTPTTTSTGNLALYLTVTAATTERAITQALHITGSIVRAVYGQCAVTGIEIMTAAERDRRNAEPATVPELAGRAEVATLLGVTPQRASQITRTAHFRASVQTVAELAATPVYLADQIRAFARLPRTPGRPRKNT